MSLRVRTISIIRNPSASLHVSKPTSMLQPYSVARVRPLKLGLLPFVVFPETGVSNAGVVFMTIQESLFNARQRGRGCSPTLQGVHLLGIFLNRDGRGDSQSG